MFEEVIPSNRKDTWVADKHQGIIGNVWLRKNNLFPVKNEVFGINMGEQATVKLLHKEKFCSWVSKTQEIDLLQKTTGIEKQSGT